MRSLVVLAAVAACTVACTPDQQLVPVEIPDAKLEITDPAPAAWLAQGEVVVHGVAENLTNVTVNDVPAEVDENGEFTATLTLARGVNLIEARGIDGHGDNKFVRQAVLSGKYGDPGNALEEAVELRVNQSGLDKAMNYAESLLDPWTISNEIQVANPIYQDSYGVFGWDAVNIYANVDWINFDPAELDADPSTDNLAVQGVLPNMWVQVNVYGDVIGFDFDEYLYVYSSAATINADLGVDTTNNGKLNVELYGSSVTLYDFWFDTTILPWEIEDLLLSDIVRGYVEEMLVEQLEEKVPPLLEEQLQSLDLSFETEMLGRDVAIEAEFSDAYIDNHGIDAKLDIDVDIPSGGNFTYAGYLLAEEVEAELDHDADVTGAISDDLLNRVLFEAWRGGVLQLDLTTDDGSLEPIMLFPLKAETGAISVRADLPPVFISNGDDLQVQIGELQVDVNTPGGGLGDHLHAAVTVFVNVEIEAKNGVLKLELDDPTVDLVVRESDWGASDEATTQLLQELLPVDLLFAMLGDFEFPLPALGDIQISKATAARDDSGSHTDVRITLDTVPQ